jgi:hypothetical protein
VPYPFSSIKFKCYRCRICGLSKNGVFINIFSGKKRGKFSERAAKIFSILAQRHHVDITVLKDSLLTGLWPIWESSWTANSLLESTLILSSTKVPLICYVWLYKALVRGIPRYINRIERTQANLKKNMLSDDFAGTWIPATLWRPLQSSGDGYTGYTEEEERCRSCPVGFWSPGLGRLIRRNSCRRLILAYLHIKPGVGNFCSSNFTERIMGFMNLSMQRCEALMSLLVGIIARGFVRDTVVWMVFGCSLRHLQTHETWPTAQNSVF